MESCPVNMSSFIRLVDIRAVLYFEKNGRWMLPPPRFQSHGGESERIPQNGIGGLYGVNLQNIDLDAEDANLDAASIKAQANAAFRSRQDWDPTDFTDPKYHPRRVQREIVFIR